LEAAARGATGILLVMKLWKAIRFYGCLFRLIYHFAKVISGHAERERIFNYLSQFRCFYRSLISFFFSSRCRQSTLESVLDATAAKEEAKVTHGIHEPSDL